MSEYNLSREEEIKIFEDRCRCEAEQPKTEEQKRRSEENQRKCEEFFRKKYGSTIGN